MKSTIFIAFLLIGVAHCFFGPISQVINNAGNSVNSVTNQVGDSINSAANQVGDSINTAANLLSESVDKFVNDIRGHVDSFIRELLNTINHLQATASSLWNNAFSPIFDMLTSGKQTPLNEKFNAIGAILGRPIAVPENPLSEKYSQLMARLKSNIHHLYEEVFMLAHDTLAAVEKGEFDFEERIRAFYGKLDAIQKQINEWVAETKAELEAHARRIEGEWTQIVSQYNQNIDLSVKTIGGMFQELTHNLMKTFINVAVSVVPNAMSIVQSMKDQGLLSFFRQ
ncbi:unnamed protein product [Adineta ricciae]|uniref:Uncharacterized protein n=1 Tax=Adineta ricciae TaxID=249248 RepID=A0A813UDD4_ADIRI|nr:unnamed protein product [Adineta ricciae]CAF0839231.1 unnamed protein product [Adineta ricciae]